MTLLVGDLKVEWLELKLLVCEKGAEGGEGAHNGMIGGNASGVG